MVSSGKPHVAFPTVVDRAYQEYKRHRKVADIMSSGVVITTPQISMAEAARIMGEHRIGSLVVVRYGTPIAIVTERDLLSRVLAADLDPGACPLKMSCHFPSSVSALTSRFGKRPGR